MSVPRTIAPYDPFAASGSSTSILPYAIAPSPSGGDDTAALQAFLDACALAKVRAILYPSQYLLAAQLVLTSAHDQLEIIGYEGKFDVAGGTELKATGAIESLIRFNGVHHIKITGLKVNAARLATYGLYLNGFTWCDDVKNTSVINALKDGVFAIGGAISNIESRWVACHFSSNGKTYATAGIAAQYGDGFGGVRQAIAGTASIAAANATITFAGAPDLTTLGIRRGDHIRVGGATAIAPAHLGQIDSVTSTTIVLQPGTDNLPTSTLAGQDYAIGVGDGYHEEPSGSNSINVFLDCKAYYNGGSGMRFCGSYGPRLWGGDTSYNNFFGRSFSMSDFVFAMDVAIVSGVYAELNRTAVHFLGNGTSFKIDGVNATGEPFSLGYTGASGTYTGPNGEEDLRLGLAQNFYVEVNENAGALRFFIAGDHYVSTFAAASQKITGATNAWTAIAQVAAGVAFAGGIGVVAADTTILLFDTSNAQPYCAPGGHEEFNDIGTNYRLVFFIDTRNVNGTTKKRMAARLVNVATGVAVNWDSAAFGAGKTFGFRYTGRLR